MKKFATSMLLGAAFLATAAYAQVNMGSQKPAADLPFTVTKVADFNQPWRIAFLPDGRMLVTERAGRLRVIEDGRLNPEPVAGLPPVYVGGQAGLFDVLPDPDFARNRTLFISFAHGSKRANHVRIVRARLDGSRLVDVRPIFTAQPAKSGDAHYGARMAFLADGTLFSVGWNDIGGWRRAPTREPASVTSRPSRTQVMPSATITSTWKRPQGRRSRRPAMSVSTTLPISARSGVPATPSTLVAMPPHPPFTTSREKR